MKVLEEFRSECHNELVRLELSDMKGGPAEEHWTTLKERASLCLENPLFFSRENQIPQGIDLDHLPQAKAVRGWMAEMARAMKGDR